jgi:hypothetical protein
MNDNTDAENHINIKPAVIASFDIGVKNLGVVILNYQTHNPVKLELVVKPDMYDKIKYLDMLMTLYEIKQVIIERQISRNTNAVRIEGVLFGYFISQHISVSFASPVCIKRKVGCPAGLSHRKRKQWVIDKVKYLLGDTYRFEGVKEDDVCDALMNAWVVLDSSILNQLTITPYHE